MYESSVRDGIIFAVVNSGTSLYSGVVIFAVLGFMAGQQGVPVADVVESGISVQTKIDTSSIIMRRVVGQNLQQVLNSTKHRLSYPLLLEIETKKNSFVCHTTLQRAM